MSLNEGSNIIHATAVSLNGRGVLIMGPSGSGKSGLALELMGYGADLVSDDRVLLETRDQSLIARTAPNLHGMIEARGIGILNAVTVDSTQIVLAVDMNQTETDRLPPHRSVVLLDVTVPVVHKSAQPSFAAAILQYLKQGRKE